MCTSVHCWPQWASVWCDPAGNTDPHSPVFHVNCLALQAAEVGPKEVTMSIGFSAIRRWREVQLAGLLF